MVAEYERVTSLIKHLQSMRGRQMWAYEEVSLRAPGQWQLASAQAMADLANALLDSIHFETELRARWAQEALRWMLEAGNRHHACRSHQVCPLSCCYHLSTAAACTVGGMGPLVHENVGQVFSSFKPQLFPWSSLTYKICLRCIPRSAIAFYQQVHP